MDASLEFFLGTGQSFSTIYAKKGWENNSVDNTLAVLCEDPSSEPLEATYEPVKCGGLPVIPGLERQTRWTSGASWLSRLVNLVSPVFPWEFFPQ